MTTYAVIDFETTGASPGLNARPTEIAVVLVRDGQLVDRYQSLMNPGQPIPWQIQQLTGITDAMVRQAPPVETVMAEASTFVGSHIPVAHNAAFDRKFWECELAALGRSPGRPFLCSLMLSRRVFPTATSHKLGSLVTDLGLPATGRYHRALADAEATAYLLLKIQETIAERFSVPRVTADLLTEVQRAPVKGLAQSVSRYLARHA